MRCTEYQHDYKLDTIYCGKCAIPLLAEDAQPFFTKTFETPRVKLTTGSIFAGL
jgi:hypothetical protein